MLRTTATPDLDDPRAAVVHIREWQTAEPAASPVRVAAAVLGTRRTDPWPAGLLAHHCLLGADDAAVLHYLQWTDEAAARADALPPPPGWREEGRAPYRPYRRTEPPAAPPPAGCLVTVTVTLADPGPRAQRDWVDGVFAAAGTAAADVDAGLLSAHFHHSLDGTRVVNLAEWTTAAAHRAATAGPPSPFRTRVKALPDVTSNVARRFVPYEGIAAG